MNGWIGYYYTVSRRFGDHLDAVKALGMNWAHIVIDNTHHFPETDAIAQRAADLGIAVSYSIANLLWIPGAPKYDRHHKDWKERFDRGRPSIDAFYNRGILHSLYVADEPTGHGIQADWLHEACEFIRLETPYKTMVIEDSISIAKPLPVLDYYGVTHYTPRVFREGHELVLRDERVNVVVAQSFNENPHAIPDQRHWKRLFDRIRHREGATLALFTWQSYEEYGKTYTGAADVPAVLAQHARWAEEIGASK
jgi:hypothetical protein